MKNKYIINKGLAFSENSLISKLNQYASEGWLFQEFSTFGLFLKLSKGEPTDYIYCMDIQEKGDEEYYMIFEAAGWKHINTSYDMYHFFQAPKDTTPIYNDSITAREKNADIRKSIGKGALYSGIILILAILMHIIGIYTFPIVATIGFFIGLPSLIVFIICFMPWVGYKWQSR
jgi:hypothetical protein